MLLNKCFVYKSPDIHHRATSCSSDSRYSDFKDAMSMEKRYFTSDFSSLS
jgi:hypothetical protein